MSSPFHEGSQPVIHRFTRHCTKPVSMRLGTIEGPCFLLLLFCYHPFHHAGPYLISSDEAIAVFVKQHELFFLKLPFRFADLSVMIGIHVPEHHIDHVLHAGVLLCRRSSSSRRWLLRLRKKQTAVNHKYDTNHD